MKMTRVVNRGEGTQPKYDRNVELVKDYKDGMEVCDMVGKYKISGARIYEVLRRVGIKKNRRPERKVEKTK